MNKGKGFDKDWFKNNTSKFQSPNDFFSSFKERSDDSKKKLMRNIFLGFCGLYGLKLFLGMLVGGGGYGGNPYQ